MTSIFSGQLYRNFVKDQNVARLENYDVNRFQRTIQQQSNQGQREKELREGLEYQQAQIANMQTKLNELIEKLNNLYRRYMDNQVAFMKVSQTAYAGTSQLPVVAGLPRVDVGGDTTGYPAGNNGIVPYDDYDKIRNFPYNPYWGSKAIDQSDKNLIRTLWEQPGVSKEEAYRENGAFWSTISYLWGWDLDRINATYTTGDLTGDELVQVNVTALQPNKPQYPPLSVGDRFPMNWTGDLTNAGNTVQPYPAINFGGLRPGGVEFAHATDTINTGTDVADGRAASNLTGEDEMNMGWEFDDLPMAMEVTSVETLPDGTTRPTGYKIVYDIPPTHPHYEELKVLNGTEPQIIDAPTELRKDRIENEGFNYTGFAYVPGTQGADVNFVAPGFQPSGYTSGTGLDLATLQAHAIAEGEWPPSKAYTSTAIPGGTFTTSGGSDFGSVTNPIQFSPVDTLLNFNTGENLTLQPQGAISPVSEVRINTLPVSGGDGISTDISVGGPLDTIGAGDYVTFSGAANSGYIYRVTTVSTAGFRVVQVFPSPPPVQTPTIAAGVNVQLWTNNAAPANPTSMADLDPKYAVEGLVVANPQATDVVTVKKADVPTTNDPITEILLTPSCGQYIAITPGTKVSMRYRFVVSENYGQVPYRSPGDDGLTPGVNLPTHSYTGYEWTSAGQQFNSPIGDNTYGGQGQYRYPIDNIPFSVMNNTLMNAGPDDPSTPTPPADPFSNRALLGRAPLPNTQDKAGWVYDASGTLYETVEAVVENSPIPGDPTLHVKFFFTGDLNNFQVEIQDMQIVTYDGDLNTWTQGQYTPAGNTPITIANGDLPVDQSDSPDDVINKYVPGVYQFTQFNDQYNLPHNASDRNDILRSPWEFAMLNIESTSSLSGEMFVDLNGRRLNLDHDVLNTTTEGWGNTTAAVNNPSGGDYIASAAVQAVHDFETVVVHPDDVCADDDYTFADADPLTSGVRTETLQDEVLSGQAPQTSTLTTPNPIRTDNPAYTAPTPLSPDFYSLATPGATPSGYTFTNHSFDYGASTDTTGTVDRVGARDSDFSYKITIPTNDANVLRNENNLLVNFGSIQNMDWALNLKNMDMDVRTIPSYTTVPRYRVDAGGNIYDAFGKGYYDLRDTNSDGVIDNQKDASSVARVYTVTDPTTMTNGQISNADRNYQSRPASYTAGATFEQMVNSNDRLSLAGDDFNLFDYVPDLTQDVSSVEGATNGEIFVGSLPTNFYYYREELDNAQGENGDDPPTGDHTTAAGVNLVQNGNKKPAINFDGHGTNPNGQFDTNHTYVHNALLPSFVNVSLGVVQQDARRSNVEDPTSFAVWQDFPGLGSPNSYAYATSDITNVTNPTGALGSSNQNFASMGFNTSSITLEMARRVNSGGYLILNEMGTDGQTVQPHAIPLPLYSTAAPYPNYDTDSLTPQSYSFDSYGVGTVTRTGSKYQPFSQILDGADGILGDGYNQGLAGNKNILDSAGGDFSTDAPADPAAWPNGILMHVDDAEDFDMTYPKNIVTLGDDATRYRIWYRNATTEPQTMYLVRDDGSAIGSTLTGVTSTPGFVHSDLQIREVTGTYTVSVVDENGDPNVDGTRVQVDYNANGTQREGRLESVEISSAMDRVGRLPGDNPLTSATTETGFIGPEIFDGPKGYVQPDALLDLHVVAQDQDGNQRPRKLKSIKVIVESGEQTIPSTLTQTYTTYNDTSTADGDPTGFSLNGGASGNWPIAVYDGDTQINPLVTDDMNFLVGYFQGVTAGSTASLINVTSAAGFGIGQVVTINGEQREIVDIVGNQLELNEPLLTPPILGDRVDLGNGSGSHDLKLFLNRSLAMSDGAGVKIIMEYEEYDVTGYPPMVDLASGRDVTEQIGFGDSSPRSPLAVLTGQTGTGSAAAPLRVTGSVDDYNVGDIINVNGQTRSINTITRSGATAGPPATPNNVADIVLASPENQAIIMPFSPAPQAGSVTHIDHEDYLVVGKGRSGGSSGNEFTQELKRIVDNPEYRELFRNDLFKNIFITSSVTDPFNDLIASKLFLNWDRDKRQLSVDQTAFSAYFKATPSA
ncbi:MAG: hypothetical protein ACO1RX_05365 [Candidatus Sericytochromatia bacterium]